MNQEIPDMLTLPIKLKIDYNAKIWPEYAECLRHRKEIVPLPGTLAISS